jgi:DNA-binding PadR family transcriptional regulator
MSRRGDLLEFAVLGLLHESPLHGYELRKRLNTVLGSFRALSYGSLYPCLRDLLDKSWIAEAIGTGLTTAGTSGSKRARIVYELTAEGKERFQDMAGSAGPATWDDEEFGVHLAFFARTKADVRLRILEGRRSRLEERLANIRAASARNRERMDGYTAALQRYGEETAEREVRWLEELISNERSSGSGGADPAGTSAGTTTTDPGRHVSGPETAPPLSSTQTTEE